MPQRKGDRHPEVAVQKRLIGRDPTPANRSTPTIVLDPRPKKRQRYFDFAIRVLCHSWIPKFVKVLGSSIVRFVLQLQHDEGTFFCGYQFRVTNGKSLRSMQRFSITTEKRGKLKHRTTEFAERAGTKLVECFAKAIVRVIRIPP